MVLNILYLPETGVNFTQLANHLRVSRRTISMIVNGSRPVTVDMVNRLTRAFCTSAQFWLSMAKSLDSEYWRVEDSASPFRT